MSTLPQPLEYVKTKYGYALVLEYLFTPARIEEWSSHENFKVSLCDLPHHIDKNSVKELVESRFVTIEYQTRVAYRCGEGFIVRY